MKLYSFFNSSSSYRIRIVLALKGISYEYVPVDIRALEHRAPDYVAMNASASVPFLIDGEQHLGQSLAIADYLDAKFPAPRLIPDEPVRRARILEFVSMIGSDIHPVNNLHVLRYLQDDLGVATEQKAAWYGHWVAEGLASAERMLERHSDGPFAFGAEPTLADCWLVPQVANALRMNCSLDGHPKVAAVLAHCSTQRAFQDAAPDRQPDFLR